MPSTTDEAHKFVREAVQAFPELYFARLVVLGEGDSEEIVLPRLLKARGVPIDESAIAVVPLGGRHVNHFWRLLTVLNIPFVSLLDLDLARFQGGWGRMRYANTQLNEYVPGKQLPTELPLPEWNDDQYKILGYSNYIAAFEQRGVFFSSPLDLDFSMLKNFPAAYEIDASNQVMPTETTIKAVLGKSFHGVEQYTEAEQKLFITYHKRFKLGSKPASHINALSKLADSELLAGMPESLARLADEVIAKLAELPE
jgi:putative ATP-dependent endonuclease of the OLD family